MNLETFIKAKGLTQAEFADALGVSQATVSKIIDGAQNATADIITRIVDQTKGAVTAADILEARRVYLANRTSSEAAE